MSNVGHPDGRTAVSGIVLAGGRSSRFGSDKLQAEIDGRTLLELAVAAVAAVSTEVIVVCSPDDDRQLPSATVPVRRASDAEAFGGPLVGLLAGLEAVAGPVVVVVGGDMPDVRPAVLATLITTLTAGDDVAAVALASRGRLLPLPAVVRTGAATDVVRRLVEAGERRLRALFDDLPTRLLEESEWRPLDPGAATLRDIDTRDDL